MPLTEIKVIIRTANGHHEFAEADFLEKPSDAVGFLNLKSAPFDGWQTAYSIDISPADTGFGMLMLAVGEHAETPQGLAFRLQAGTVNGYSDFND